MMLTVAPVQEKNSVTSFRTEVRWAASVLLSLSSEVPRCFRGPSEMAQPIASTMSHHTAIGARARTARSRAASRAEGRDWSSCHRVRKAIR